jgi:hypothetical protein
MIFTFELDDQFLPSIEQYLAIQIKAKNDEVTGAQVLTRVYQDAHDLFEQTLGQLTHQIVQQYPTPEIREQMVQAKAIQDGIKAKVSPKRVVTK